MSRGGYSWVYSISFVLLLCSSQILVADLVNKNVHYSMMCNSKHLETQLPIAEEWMNSRSVYSHTRILYNSQNDCIMATRSYMSSS